MAEKRNLGRGLGDIMEEVSDVQAVPEQPAADVAADEPAAASEPQLVEERAPDAEINSQQPLPRVEEKIVRQPFIPLWTKIAVAMLAGIVAVLAATLVQMQHDLKGAAARLKTAQDALNVDPLAWTADLHRDGVRIRRTDRSATLVFDAPFFAGDVRWSPASDQILRDLLMQIAPHQGECFITIVGHTGRTPLPPGSPLGDNYDLGLRRAESVMEAMVRIVKWPASGISAKSDGEKFPPFRGDDPLSQARNRTITIELRPI